MDSIRIGGSLDEGVYLDMWGMTEKAVGSVEYGAGGTLLLVGNSRVGRELWESAARIAGCRIADQVPLEAAAAGRLGAQLAADAFVLDVEREEEALPAALAALASAAREREREGLITAPAAMLDAVAPQLLSERIHYLIDASVEERAMALVRAANPAAPILNDIGRGHATARLQQLSEEVGRIASILAALSEDEAAAAAVAGIECGEGLEGERLEPSLIRAIIRARRLRDHFFRSELFADPAWDMLLDLMAARLERQRVAVSSLCIAAAVPPTTALRWIKALCDQGLFVRVADPEDGRRVFIELSEASATAMENYLRAAQRVSALVV